MAVFRLMMSSYHPLPVLLVSVDPDPWKGHPIPSACIKAMRGRDTSQRYGQAQTAQGTLSDETILDPRVHVIQTYPLAYQRFIGGGNGAPGGRH